jgi:phosphohistidine swiveling domain-containing protein
VYTNYTGLLVRFLNWVSSGHYNRSLLYNLLSCPSSIAVRRDKRLLELTRLLTTPAGAAETNWLAYQSPEFRSEYERYCNDFGYVFADANPRDPYSRVNHALAFRLLKSYQSAAVGGPNRQAEKDVFDLARRRRFGVIYLLIFKALRFVYEHGIGHVKEDRNHVFYLAAARIREFVTRERSELCEELSLPSIESIYFMSLDEIRSGKRKLPLIEYRKKMYELSNEFVDPHGRSMPAMVPQAGIVLNGIPCSPGTARGSVVFVRTRNDFAKVTPDSILVTDDVRPFWTPILATVQGLLSSSGNVLSHGASVAREYGVPAVFGLGEAAFSLQEGDIVTVNGFTGQVHRVHGRPSTLSAE